MKQKLSIYKESKNFEALFYNASLELERDAIPIRLMKRYIMLMKLMVVNFLMIRLILMDMVMFSVICPTPKASPLTVQPTLGGLAPMLKRMRPLGSFVLNLNDIVPVFTASHFGRICK